MFSGRNHAAPLTIGQKKSIVTRQGQINNAMRDLKVGTKEKTKWIGMLKSMNRNQDKMVLNLIELNELLVRVSEEPVKNQRTNVQPG